MNLVSNLMSEPKVAYRETIREKIEQEKYINKVVVAVNIRVYLRTSELGAGYEFVNAIAGGAIPENIFSSR